MEKEIFRGQIYFYNLRTDGHIASGSRPVLILQNDKGNRTSTTTIVAPITSRLNKRRYPSQVEVAPMDSGLYCTSVIKCEQLITVNKSDIGRYIGEVKEEIMQEVAIAIRRHLDI